MDFHKIVKKLSKKGGTVVSLIDIARLITGEKEISSEDMKSAYRISYRLRSSGVAIPLRNGLFFFPNADDAGASEIQILDRHASCIIRKVIMDTTGGAYFIGSVKALSLHLRDFSVVERLVVYTPDTMRLVRIAPQASIAFRTIARNDGDTTVNLFSVLKKYTAMMDVDGVSLRVASGELALLDTLLIRSSTERIPHDMVIRYLRRYAKTLDRDILGRLVCLRYISAINRLRGIATVAGYPRIAEMCLDIIKREGRGCFVSV